MHISQKLQLGLNYTYRKFPTSHSHTTATVLLLANGCSGCRNLALCLRLLSWIGGKLVSDGVLSFFIGTLGFVLLILQFVACLVLGVLQQITVKDPLAIQAVSWGKANFK